jgi:protein-tyrosine phosphatase
MQPHLKKILFLCTGNYYRSRFAEHYFNQLASTRRLNWRAFSRGLAIGRFGENSGPISSHAVEALLELSVPLPTVHRFPEHATTADFQSADYVVAVKRDEHHSIVAEEFPESLVSTEFWVIHDLDVEEPVQALPQLQLHVEELVERLLREQTLR